MKTSATHRPPAGDTRFWSSTLSLTRSLAAFTLLGAARRGQKRFSPDAGHNLPAGLPRLKIQESQWLGVRAVHPKSVASHPNFLHLPILPCLTSRQLSPVVYQNTKVLDIWSYHAVYWCLQTAEASHARSNNGLFCDVQVPT